MNNQSEDSKILLKHLKYPLKFCKKKKKILNYISLALKITWTLRRIAQKDDAVSREVPKTIFFSL